MKINRPFNRVVAVVAAATATVPLMFLFASNTTASPTYTYTRTFPCSVSGFEGVIEIEFRGPSSTRAEYINDVRYKINKGSNNGGNNANVSVGDYGVLPKKSYGTSKGIQDNTYLWASLRDSTGKEQIKQ